MAAEMKQRGRCLQATWLALAGLLLFVVAGYASDGDTKSDTGTDIDLPEVGVRLTHLPEGATRGKDIDYAYAYSGVVRIGEASLTILRAEDPAPAGATLADRSYRSAARDFFRSTLPNAIHLVPNRDDAGGRMTSVGGQAAWSECQFLHMSEHVVRYQCTTYVVANDHLYSLRAFLKATDGPRPPEFDALVQGISDIAFVQVARPTASSGVQLKAPMPVYISPSELKFHEEGVVDMAFNVDEKGHAYNLRQTYASSSGLSAVSQAYVNGLVFKVPVNWKEKGSQDAVFTMEQQFSLARRGEPCIFPEHPLPQDVLALIKHCELR